MPLTISSRMALTPAVEVTVSSSHEVAVIQTDPLARPSFESGKTYQPDIINLENLGTEETPSPTQGEPPVAIGAPSLDIRKLNIKFAVICLALFLEGWNLGATGPLIPAIQKYYKVRLSLTQNTFFKIQHWADKLRSCIDDIPGSMCCKSFFTRANVPNLGING